MSMPLFRACQKKDIDGILNLATESGIGITSLPKNRDTLAHRIELSVDSFKKKTSKPSNEYYLFVLEDSINQNIIGTAAIEATLGVSSPFYNYRIAKHTHISEALGIRSDLNLLFLVTDNQNKSELCTLYLQPTSRKSNFGLFLSRARFLFMAQHPERFESKVIAEIRGFIDKNGESPFWNHVGKKFFQIPFDKADALTLSFSKQFIIDLLPEYPIFVQLLHQEAQQVIGHPHPSSLGAEQILLNEGFVKTDYVDIFDAGPTLEASCNQIHTINNSVVATVTDFNEAIEKNHQWMIANTSVSMRATIGSVQLKDNQAMINKETAELLHIKRGDLIRIASMRKHDE